MATRLILSKYNKPCLLNALPSPPVKFSHALNTNLTSMETEVPCRINHTNIRVEK